MNAVDPKVLEALGKAMSGGVTPSDSRTWEYKVATHRAHHDSQRWRRWLAAALYRLGDGLDRLADRVEPWHEDDEWFTAEPGEPMTFTFTASFDAEGKPEFTAVP